ncbi:sensor histidine kinase [Spirosoma aerophilum]
MLTSSDFLSAPLSELATYIFARREAILANWRMACESDPSLHTPMALSREEFNDKVPVMLNLLDQRLRAPADEPDVKARAAEHGLHRWHKGYDLHELLGEMKFLHQILMAELRQYWMLRESVDKHVMAVAYELIAWFSDQTIDGSVEQYTSLQQMAANERVYTLERALERLNDLTRQRSDLLRASSHDLRGSFGLINSAAYLLKTDGMSESEREQMQDMLNRNLLSVREMVVQLMDLARLEAGQEQVNIKQFDVADLIRTQLAAYQPMAHEQGLMLIIDGPSGLEIESDSVLIQRILQNLVLNALKHTASGLVSVSWSRENDYRWFISVQDTGPGLPTGNASGIAQALTPTIDSTSGFGEEVPQAAPTETTANVTSTGEGIGLSIVKRLCELLRASLDIETKPEVGTLFRVRLPIKWDS